MLHCRIVLPDSYWPIGTTSIPVHPIACAIKWLYLVVKISPEVSCSLPETSSLEWTWTGKEIKFFPHRVVFHERCSTRLRRQRIASVTPIIFSNSGSFHNWSALQIPCFEFGL